MGIPRFAGALKQRVPAAFGSRVPPQVDSAFIDLNSFFYGANAVIRGGSSSVKGKDPEAQRQARRAQRVQKQDPALTKAQFLQEITNMIEKTTRQIRPSNTLYLGVDGGVVVAKAQQQRGRRFKGVKERKPSDFDTNAFTPGTEVMVEIDAALQAWSDNQATFDRLGLTQIIYSPWTVPGEGEHKIMDYFRSGQVKGDGAKVVVGMDADLIILSLMSPLDGIHLWREDQNVRFHTIDIDKLRLGLLTQLEKPSALRDFGLMAILVGNDFLPKYPLIADLDVYFEIAFEVYKSFEGELVSIAGEINWDNLTLFLAGLQARENRLVDDFRKARLFQPLGSFEQAITRMGNQFKFDSRKFAQEWYHHALSPKKPEQISKLGLSFNSEELIQPMAIAYLQGMEWVMRYYLQGARSTDQTYFYPYYYAPLLSDLVQTLETLDHQVLNLPSLDFQMTPWEQLLAVLPTASKKLLPTALKKLMGLKSPILDLYPEDFEVDLDGKGREHEGIAMIPFADPFRIRDAVLALTPAEYHQFLPGKVLTTYNLNSARTRPRALVRGVSHQVGRGSIDRSAGRGTGGSGRSDQSTGGSGRGAGRGTGGSGRGAGRGRYVRGTQTGYGTRTSAFSANLLM